MAIPYAPLVKSLSGKLFKPTTLAVLASVGLHAFVLGVGLPSKPMFSQAEIPSQRRTVRLIELSPVEQARLPDFSSVSANVNPSPALELPEAAGLDAIPLQPTQEQVSLPQLPSLSSSSLPPLASLPRSWQSIPIPSLPGLPPPPALNPLNQFRQPQSLPNPIDGESLLARQRVLENYPAPVPTAPQDIRELINQRQPVGLPTQVPPDSTGVTQPTLPNEREVRVVRVEQMSPEEIANRRLQGLLAQGEQLRDKLRRDSANTSEQEANSNYLSWVNRTTPETAAKIDKAVKTSIAGTYPKDACLRKIEGTAAYAVRIDPQGKVTNPELVQSSGYPLLNEQALQDLKSTSFANPTQQLKPYIVSVNFKYNPQICPSLTVQPTATTGREVNREVPMPSAPEPKKPVAAPAQNPPPNQPESPALEALQSPASKKPENTSGENQNKPNNLEPQPTNNSPVPEPSPSVAGELDNSGVNNTQEEPQQENQGDN